jgi:hypothetical protein
MDPDILGQKIDKELEQFEKNMQKKKKYVEMLKAEN